LVDVKIEGNRARLENYKIKNVWLVPEWEIVTTEETYPLMDEFGNPTGQIISKFNKVSRVLLKPQEVNGNAFQKPTAEEVHVFAAPRNSKKMGKRNFKEKETSEESKEEKEVN